MIVGSATKDRGAGGVRVGVCERDMAKPRLLDGKNVSGRGVEEDMCHVIAVMHVDRQDGEFSPNHEVNQPL